MLLTMSSVLYVVNDVEFGVCCKRCRVCCMLLTMSNVMYVVNDVECGVCC